MQAKRKVGRPTVMTPDAIGKLEEAFALDCSDLEACLMANISVDALYDYQLKHPEFTKRKEQLKETPVLLARQTVNRHIQDSYQNGMDYLSRKKKLEFSQRSEHTGADGKDLIPAPEDREEANKAIGQFLDK